MKRRLALGSFVAATLAAGLWFANRGAPRAPELPVPAAEAPAPTRAPAAQTVAEPEAARRELRESDPVEVVRPPERAPERAPLRIRVVDELGQPQQAWLEIGPYEPGKSASELYPPTLHVVTGHDGTSKLPLPAGVAIVRAQQITPRGLAPNGHMSANVRIDPAFPPAEVELVILDQARVRLSGAVPEARKLQLLDEMRLVVLDAALELPRELEFPRGRYELRLLGAEDVILYQRSIVLRAGDQELELP